MVKSANKIIAKVNEVFKIPKLVLSISNPIVPRIYGLPKIHKLGNKMRSISPDIDAPSNNL